jgi:hypothetical protein
VRTGAGARATRTTGPEGGAGVARTIASRELKSRNRGSIGGNDDDDDDDDDDTDGADVLTGAVATTAGPLFGRATVVTIRCNTPTLNTPAWNTAGGEAFICNIGGGAVSFGGAGL